jgi:hypothetical protein
MNFKNQFSLVYFVNDSHVVCKELGFAMRYINLNTAFLCQRKKWKKARPLKIANANNISSTFWLCSQIGDTVPIWKITVSWNVLTLYFNLQKIVHISLWQDVKYIGYTLAFGIAAFNCVSLNWLKPKIAVCFHHWLNMSSYISGLMPRFY